jgi:serine/threonine-protein kinase
VAPPDRVRALRGDLDVIVQTAMAKAPARRYASADALRADLLATLDDLPIAARAPSRMDRAARFVRRNRGTVAAAAAVLLALAGGLVATTWQARVARAEAAKAQAVQDFLGNMLSAAGLEAEGRDVRVADLLDQAAASLDTAFARQPAVRADAHDRLGRTYYDLGLLDEASAQYRLSLALHERLYGADDPRTATVQVFLATARRELSDYRTADSLYAVALATRERVLGADHPQTAVALSEIGTLRYQQGDNAGAAAAYRRMLDIEEGVLAPDDPGLAISYANLAAALAGLDQTDEAARLLQRAVGIDRARERTPQAEMNLANTLSNLGALYARAERFEDAARVQAEAVALFRRALGDDHPSTAFGLSNYGSTLTSLGRAREAEPLLRESVATYRAALGDENPTVGFPTINLAKALAAQGRTAEALAQARAARVLFVGGFEPGHWAIERADEVLAGLASARP